MGQVPPGTWKLFVYPLIIVIILNLIFIAIFTPFAKEGIAPDNFQSLMLDYPKKILIGETLFQITFPIPGLPDLTWDVKTYPFFFTQQMKDYIGDYFDTLKLVPAWLLIPFVLITIFLFIYGIIVIAIAVIP